MIGIEVSSSAFVMVPFLLTLLQNKCLLTPIMITSPCNEHPLTPHFYIVKLGFTGVYINIFIIQFALKRRLWVPVRTVYPQSMF